MYLSHLSLTHFRNYHRLEVDFHGKTTLLQGANAQGKTNLLEAIFFLATSKPVHASSEREVVDWQASDEPIPYSRITARIHVDGREVEPEILLTPRGDGVNFKKQIRINGVPRRGMDLVGLLRAVLFLPEDIRLVDGGPSDRRRYLDIALCQMDRNYCRALSQYNKVLEQRNSLLRSMREQSAGGIPPSAEDQLRFWDEQVATLGSTIMVGRSQLLHDLEISARPLQTELSGGGEDLALQYLPSFNPGVLSDTDFAFLADERFAAEIALRRLPPLEPVGVHTAFLNKFAQRRRRELEAGVTLYGPHRDDFRFLLNGRDLRLYGSRGQQRSAALALKLAEVRTMTSRTGTAPILLLDDVMSELDVRRRTMLLNTLANVEQAVLTTTDWDDYTPEFRLRAQKMVVVRGSLVAAEASPEPSGGSKAI
jgi:DNA replication and repair protein RecF